MVYWKLYSRTLMITYLRIRLFSLEEVKDPTHRKPLVSRRLESTSKCPGKFVQRYSWITLLKIEGLFEMKCFRSRRTRRLPGKCPAVRVIQP